MQTKIYINRNYVDFVDNGRKAAVSGKNGKSVVSRDFFKIFLYKTN